MPNWRIEYTDQAEADILAMDSEVSRRIRSYFRERVAQHPDPQRMAEPLQGTWAGLHRFRVGDYRAVCHIDDDKVVILVLVIDHRSRVYARRNVPSF